MKIYSNKFWKSKKQFSKKQAIIILLILWIPILNLIADQICLLQK